LIQVKFTVAEPAPRTKFTPQPIDASIGGMGACFGPRRALAAFRAGCE
jgi:hypothetical protein